MKEHRCVEELKTPADLSYHSFNSAIKQLGVDHLSNQGKRYIIACASQNIGTAGTILAFTDNVYLKLNIEYLPDEWHVEFSYISEETYCTRIVHSVGA
jgi:hypothetical protein